MLLTKVLKKTKHFNANQKVKVVELSGNEHAYLRGQFRGNGRWISTWIKKSNMKWPLIEVPDPKHGEINV